MGLVRGVAAATALLVCATPLLASSILPTPKEDLACRFRHPVQEVASFDALPAPVRAFLTKRMADGPHDRYIIAARGADFQNSDVIDPQTPPLWRRFIRAGHVGPVWFLWYEHTGITYVRMATFVRLDLSRQAQLLAHVVYGDPGHRDPCVLTDAVVDGHLPPADLATEWW